MKNILLVIHDDRGQEVRYQAALALTRAFGGHLTCLDLTIIPDPVGDFIGRAGVLLVQEQGREARNRERMLPRLQREDVSFDWVDRTDFITQGVEKQAGLMDLIVLGTGEHEPLMPHMADVIGELLKTLGTPILALPQNVASYDPIGETLIAWDGSSEVEAAVRAAMPLLKLSRDVTLFYADDGSLRLPIEDAARYLSRHGIEPRVKVAVCDVTSPSAVLLNEVRSGGYAQVVMGGYRRGPAFQAIFGGVTRSMLTRCPVPVLLSRRS